ncbi:MAG: chorismate-binding protein [Bacteroidales bacterium]|nr:chorismate-binding protein [Bacteroidales bacterium]
MKFRYKKLLSSLISENKIFVSFRLPGDNSYQTIIQKKQKINFIDSFNNIDNEKGFIFSPFHENIENKTVLIKPDIVFNNDSIINEIEKIPGNFVKEKTFENLFSISKEEYLKQCRKMIDEIKKGSFQKAILSRIKLIEKKTNYDSVNLFFALTIKYPDAFIYLVNLPGLGTWLGASPETLLNISNGRAKTIALAGTQKNTGQAEKDVVWEKKEIEEQNYVSDYIRNIFGKFNIIDFQQSKTSTKSAGNVFHLQTDFEFNSEKIKNKLGKFIQELHPTPAVCGTPRESSLKYILKNENHNREYYSGFLGTLNLNNTTSLFVNLRCLKVLPEKLALFVGGGITQDSIPEKEWEETCHKAKTLLSVIENLPIK